MYLFYTAVIRPRVQYGSVFVGLVCHHNCLKINHFLKGCEAYEWLRFKTFQAMTITESVELFYLGRRCYLYKKVTQIWTDTGGR